MGGIPLVFPRRARRYTNHTRPNTQQKEVDDKAKARALCPLATGGQLLYNHLPNLYALLWSTGGALWAFVTVSYTFLFYMFGQDAFVGALEKRLRRHRKTSLRPWAPEV